MRTQNKNKYLYTSVNATCKWRCIGFEKGFCTFRLFLRYATVRKIHYVDLRRVSCRKNPFFKETFWKNLYFHFGYILSSLKRNQITQMLKISRSYHRKKALNPTHNFIIRTFTYLLACSQHYCYNHARARKNRYAKVVPVQGSFSSHWAVSQI